ncbi:MAG: hypothetical protein GY737_08685 [Desulfobacteraceae bacterium]|nr:hypothetical protein [Desulfobacteraceae bacterium]
MGKEMTRLHDRPFDGGTGWCTDCHGLTYSFEGYAGLAQSFHGYAAPGELKFNLLEN